MKNLIEIKENVLNPSIYLQLHEDAGFKLYDYNDVAFALSNNLFDLVLYEENKAVGMVRIVGDGCIAFFIKDFIIKSEYQGKGYGRRMMEQLFVYLSKYACKGAYVGLMSTKGLEPFYEKFGFIRRPNQDLGSGMVLFYEK